MCFDDVLSSKQSEDKSEETMRWDQNEIVPVLQQYKELKYSMKVRV